MSRSPIVSTPTPEAPAGLGPDHGWDRTAWRIGSIRRRAVLCKIRSPTDSRNVDPFEDLRLGLGPEPLDPGDLARLGRGAEVGEALDLEVVVQRLDLLRARGRARGAGRPGRGRLAGVHRKRGGSPVVASWVRSSLSIVSPIPGTSARRAVVDHPREVGGEPFQRLGGVVIGAAPEGVLAPDFEQGPHLVEDAGNPGGFHYFAPPSFGGDT